MRATTAETMEERSWPARRIYYILCVTQRGRESNQLASGGCVHARSMVCAWWPVQLYVCTYIPYLEQLADIAGAEDLVHAGELVRLPGREVGREDAAGRAPAPQQLARRARRRPGGARLRSSSSSSCRGPGSGHRHDHRVPHRSANGSGELEARPVELEYMAAAKLGCYVLTGWLLATCCCCFLAAAGSRSAGVYECWSWEPFLVEAGQAALGRDRSWESICSAAQERDTRARRERERMRDRGQWQLLNRLSSSWLEVCAVEGQAVRRAEGQRSCRGT
jgi:hypothetical protein